MPVPDGSCKVMVIKKLDRYHHKQSVGFFIIYQNCIISKGAPFQLPIWKDNQPNDDTNNNNYSQLKMGELYDVENNDGNERAILCQYSNPDAVMTFEYSLSNGNFGELVLQVSFTMLMPCHC